MTPKSSTDSLVPKIVLPFLAIAVGIAATTFMLRTRVTPDRQPATEIVAQVEAVGVEKHTEQVLIQASGTVTAARQIQLRPEVAGRIVELDPALVPGGLFAAGDVLLRIDDRDYRAALAARREALAGARLGLRQEQARQAVAEEEWHLLSESIDRDRSNRDLALRLPQIEQATAAVEAAEAAVAKAELDLERCTLTAPFDAVVLRESVDLGQVVNPQSEIAALAGTDSYWVQVSLPVEQLAWIDLPGGGSRTASSARVIFEAGATSREEHGRVSRLLGDVDPAGRLARLLIVIDDPLRLAHGRAPSRLPLLLGSYVSVEIAGREVENGIRIPRQALRELRAPGSARSSEGIWVMDSDDRLRTRAVEVVWRSTDSVLISNHFSDGERIVVSNIPTPIDGMKLRLVEPELSAGESDR